MKFFKEISIYKIILDYHSINEYDRYNVSSSVEKEFNKFQYNVAVNLYDKFKTTEETNNDKKVLFIFKNTNAFDILRRIGDKLPEQKVFSLNNIDAKKYADKLFVKITITSA